MATDIAWDIQLVQCRYRETDPTTGAILHDGDVPEGQALLVLQEALPHPVHLDVRVDDPAVAQEFIALWQPYKAGVDAAIAAKQPWPEAPRFHLALTPLP